MLRRILTNREVVELALYMRSNPIDDQSNHHLPIASLQATIANIMGGNRRVSDFLIFGDRGSGEGGGGSDSEIDAILRNNFDD